jgi:hypothetical protein
MFKHQKSISAFLGIAFLLLLMMSTATSVMFGQSADRSIYRFLTLSQSARATALGGSLVATLDPDVDMLNLNPAFLHSGMDRSWALSLDNGIGGINRSSLQSVYSFDKWGTFGLSIHHVNYGEIEQRNSVGDQLGNFSPYDFQLSIIHSKQIDQRLRIGIASHFIQSRYAQFKATALGLNGGIYYGNQDKRQSFGLTFSHIGTQINRFNSSNEPFPFSIDAGFSQRLLYLPFEWHLSFVQINKWDRTLVGEQANDVPFIQMLGRHLVFGGELTIAKALQFRFSYNPWRNQNINFSEEFDFSGSALGLGINFKRFKLNLSRQAQGDIGPNWHVGILKTI